MCISTYACVYIKTYIHTHAVLYIERMCCVHREYIHSIVCMSIFMPMDLWAYRYISLFIKLIGLQ